MSLSMHIVTEDEARPCPKCLKTQFLVLEMNSKKFKVTVTCSNCFTRGISAETPDEAVSLWNEKTGKKGVWDK